MPGKGNRNILNVSSVKKDGGRKDQSPCPEDRTVNENIQNFEKAAEYEDKPTDKPEPTPMEKILLEIKESNEKMPKLSKMKWEDWQKN